MEEIDKRISQMSQRELEVVQKLFADSLDFPESDDSDSDFDPDEYESDDSDTDDDFEDSGEEPEQDLTHIDPRNILQPPTPLNSSTI